MLTDSALKNIFLVILTAVFLPFVLIIVEQTWLPYPAFVEEIVKLLVIVFVILDLSSLKQKILAGLLFGFLLGLSENVFYLTNIIENGQLAIFWQRFLLTMPMHIITVLIMVLAGSVRKRFIVFGLAGAIILHILFNEFVIRFLI